MSFVKLSFDFNDNLIYEMFISKIWPFPPNPNLTAAFVLMTVVANKHILAGKATSMVNSSPTH